MKFSVFIVILFLLFIVTAKVQDTLSPDRCSDGGSQIRKYLDEKAVAGCAEIKKDSSLNDEEKKMLVLSLAYPAYEGPSHDFIKDWNLALASEFDEAPEGVSTQSKIFIKDAWVKMFSVMPSVKDSGTLYARESGTALAGYHFRIVSPPIPTTCTTYYTLQGWDYEFNMYLNGVKINKDNEKIASYKNAPSNMNFKAELIVNAWGLEIQRKYIPCLTIGGGGKKGKGGKSGGSGGSKMSSFGSSSNSVLSLASGGEKNGGKNGKKKGGGFSCGCRTVLIKPHIEKIPISDPLNAKKYNFNYELDYKMDKKNKAVLELNSYGPLNFFKLLYGRASYSLSDYIYDVKYTYPPYNILTATVKRRSIIEDSKQNIIASTSIKEYPSSPYENKLKAKVSLVMDPKELKKGGFDLTHCDAAIASHFGKVILNDFCELGSKGTLPPTELNIHVDSVTFEKGEIIPVHISMKNDGKGISGVVNVTFQDESKQVEVKNGQSDLLEFKAKTGGMITAIFETDMKHSSARTFKQIFVSNNKAWWDVISIGIFIGCWYAIYVGFRRASGFKW